MWIKLQIFGFRALWSPYYLLFVILLGLAYFLITGPLRHKFGVQDHPSIKQKFSFYIGLLLLYIIKGSPVDLVSHIMLSAHMAQMALYYLVFPALIIKGIPVEFWRKFIRIPVIRSIFKIITKPLIALFLFNGLFSIYHIPEVFDFTKASPLAHAVITTVILIAAFAVWWPIFTPLEEHNTLSPLMKLGYIFANGVLLTPACALIIFSNTPLYETYSQSGSWMNALSLCVPQDVLSGLTLSGPELFSPISILYDQQLGGIIMKITQEIVYGTYLGIIFFKWVSQEKNTIDPIPSGSSN
ncbi:cytochrome c oxidase assembly factor CtaG [Bacillaceae bacterium S4-13-58]